MSTKKNLLILSTSSDFAINLSPFFLNDKWRLFGTARYSQQISSFIEVFICDFSNESSVDSAVKLIKEKKIQFDLILNCVGVLNPIGLFESTDSREWKRNIEINSINPIMLIKDILSFQSSKDKTNVIFFSGSGTNDAAVRYSAYTASKILLIKLTEILDAEYNNVIFTILGPGVVDTKIHEQTFLASLEAGENLNKLEGYYNGNKIFTSYKKIYDFITWVISNNKKIVGGKNFSILNDNINSPKLIKSLCDDDNFFKLRRFGNDFK